MSNQQEEDKEDDEQKAREEQELEDEEKYDTLWYDGDIASVSFEREHLRTTSFIHMIISIRFCYVIYPLILSKLETKWNIEIRLNFHLRPSGPINYMGSYATRI